jgi:hypothetical protein
MSLRPKGLFNFGINLETTYFVSTYPVIARNRYTSLVPSFISAALKASAASEIPEAFEASEALEVLKVSELLIHIHPWTAHERSRSLGRGISKAKVSPSIASSVSVVPPAVYPA